MKSPLTWEELDRLRCGSVLQQGWWLFIQIQNRTNNIRSFLYAGMFVIFQVGLHNVKHSLLYQLIHSQSYWSSNKSKH